MASQHFLHGYRFKVHGDFKNKHQILFTVWLIDSTGIRIRCFCAFPVDLIGERMMPAWKKRCPYFLAVFVEQNLFSRLNLNTYVGG